MLVAALASGCDKFLDTLPDNRTTLDSEEKIKSMLVSAYPSTSFMLVTEFMSDNVDDMGESNPYHDRFIDQVYHWEDITEADNEDTESIWNSSYGAIASANHALEAIDQLEKENGVSDGLEEARAEALLCRAYNHFVLVNVFCQQYDSAMADSLLGIPYSLEPERMLAPQYERGTVAQVYDLIDKDIQAALPKVNDYYTIAKYHFNQRAAYAFAARFYLYYEKWDLAEKYATMCLGETPATLLRDWDVMGAMDTDEKVLTRHYVESNLNCNFLLMTAYSSMGLAFTNYYMYARYCHNSYLSESEDYLARQIWGSGDDRYYMRPFTYLGNNIDRVVIMKLPYLFEYTDPVAQIGYYRTVYPAFTADECLLNRAEARIMQDKYDDAAKDLETWMLNIIERPSTKTLTTSSIVKFYNGVSNSTWNSGTVKKQLNPKFDIGKAGGTKEAMLQCVVGFRRIETLQTGLRWFDIKRYGIEIERRVMSAAGRPSYKTDVLKVDDPRRAIQIPMKVRSAGLEANPR